MDFCPELGLSRKPVNDVVNVKPLVVELDEFIKAESGMSIHLCTIGILNEPAIAAARQGFHIPVSRHTQTSKPVPQFILEHERKRVIVPNIDIASLKETKNAGGISLMRAIVRHGLCGSPSSELCSTTDAFTAIISGSPKQSPCWGDIATNNSTFLEHDDIPCDSGEKLVLGAPEHMHVDDLFAFLRHWMGRGGVQFKAFKDRYTRRIIPALPDEQCWWHPEFFATTTPTKKGKSRRTFVTRRLQSGKKHSQKGKTLTSGDVEMTEDEWMDDDSDYDNSDGQNHTENLVNGRNSLGGPTDDGIGGTHNDSTSSLVHIGISPVLKGDAGGAHTPEWPGVPPNTVDLHPLARCDWIKLMASNYCAELVSAANCLARLPVRIVVWDYGVDF